MPLWHQRRREILAASINRTLKKLGVSRGQGHISVFHNVETGIKTLVHGDDDFSSGSHAIFDCLEKQLSDEYEIKTQRVCGREVCTKEGKILNRIVRWTPQGYELEGDPRHAELVFEQLGVQDLPSSSSPGIDCIEAEAGEEDDVELDAVKATLYRGIAARCNYLAVDRPELQFTVKESCREMSKPTVGSSKTDGPRVTVLQIGWHAVLNQKAIICLNISTY